MSDDVTRLRRLRRAALKVRALAAALHPQSRYADGHDELGSLYARAALLGWRISRIATGRLRAHPYEGYQKDPGVLETCALHTSAHLKAALATLRRRGLLTFLQQMSATARELDDARALTLSAEFSEALERAQHSMRLLMNETRSHLAAVSSGQPVSGSASAPVSAARSPYLAL